MRPDDVTDGAGLFRGGQGREAEEIADTGDAIIAFLQLAALAVIFGGAAAAFVWLAGGGAS